MDSPTTSTSNTSLFGQRNLDRIYRPYPLSCADCKCESYSLARIINGHLDCSITLCELHKTNLFAIPVNPITIPTSSSTSAPNPTSPTPGPAFPRSPTNNSCLDLGSPPSPTSPVVRPGAGRTIPISRRLNPAPATLRTTVSIPIRARSRSPNAVQHDQDVPARSTADGNRTRTHFRSTIPQASRDIYEEIRDKVLNGRSPMSIQNAIANCSVRKMSDRTWRRKRAIAELMILDSDKFDEVLDQQVRRAAGRKVNQQKLSDRCDDILNQADYKIKRRAAVAAGILI